MLRPKISSHRKAHPRHVIPAFLLVIPAKLVPGLNGERESTAHDERNQQNIPMTEDKAPDS